MRADQIERPQPNYGLCRVEAALADFFHIKSAFRTSFLARIKNFQRLGISEEIKTGRGRAASYSPHHALLLGLAIEMGAIGCPPETAVSLIKTHRVDICRAVKRVLKSQNETLFCIVQASSISGLSSASSEYLEFVGQSPFLKILSEPKPDALFRVAAFSFSGLVSGISRSISCQSDAERDAFMAGLFAWDGQ